MAALKRVLYVDDDPDLRALADLALGTVGGLCVSLCDRGEMAVETVRRSGVQLVLLDAVMPGMDGPATLAALHAHPETADVPVLFVTALDGADDRAALLSLGAVDIIPKPLDLMAMADQVRAIWNRIRSRTG